MPKKEKASKRTDPSTGDQLKEDIKQLEQYERQAKLSDAQRHHLKVSYFSHSVSR